MVGSSLFVKLEKYVLAKGRAHQHLEDQPYFWWWWNTSWMHTGSRVIIWWAGVTWVKYNNQKISDFLPDYDEKYSGPVVDPYVFLDKTNRAPLTISNHVGQLDMIVYLGQ
jgi:hypothetical protein